MVKPLGDKIVIEVISVDQTPAGLFLPQNRKEKPDTATVLAVGTGKLFEGVRVPLDVKVGDTIIFNKHMGIDMKIDGKQVLIIRESDVLAVINGG